MKWLFLMTCILIIFTSQIVTAESYNLDISADLIDGNGQLIEDINAIPLNQNLGIRLQIINANDFWINPNTITIRFESKKNGERSHPITSHVVNNEVSLNDVYIPPNSKKEIYIVLENYNEFDENKRSGSWEILFDVYLSHTNGFFSDNYGDMNSFVVEAIKPNNILFNAQNNVPELEKNYNIPNLSYVVDKVITPINSIIALVIGLITLGAFLKSRKS